MTPEPVLPSSFESLRKRLLSKAVFFVFLFLILTSSIVIYLYFSGSLRRLGLFKPPTPQVELKTEYQNPFKSEAQYVNPFTEFKNPFDNL